MSTSAQIKALVNPENKARRVSQKERILRYLEINLHTSFTYSDISDILDIRHSNCQARMSELRSKGEIKVVGETNGLSRYRFGESKKLMTTNEAYTTAINEYCPMFLTEIMKRVKELTK